MYIQDSNYVKSHSKELCENCRNKRICKYAEVMQLKVKQVNELKDDVVAGSPITVKVECMFYIAENNTYSRASSTSSAVARYTL